MSSNPNAAHPRFSDGEFARRYKAVHGMMAEHGLDALIVYGAVGSSAEVQYLTDFRTAREAYVVLPAQDNPTLFVQYFNHVPNARRRARVAAVQWAGAHSVSTLVAHLRDLELNTGRVGLVGALPWQQHLAFATGLSRVEFVDSTIPFQHLRLIKSKEELTFLRRGAELSDLAMEALEREVRPGIAEYELAAIVEGAYLPLGGQTHIHYMATTSMRNPVLCVPAQFPSDRVLQTGDVLITEISAQFDGYPGQILRPFSIGEPPTADYQRLYDVALHVFERIAAVIRPGAVVEDVLNSAEEIAASGYTICDDLLHGFGGGYLPPLVRTRQTGGARHPGFIFAEDMTVVIQPNVITPDERMGIQVGELVRVTHTGVERLHHYPMRFTQCG